MFKLLNFKLNCQQNRTPGTFIFSNFNPAFVFLTVNVSSVHFAPVLRTWFGFVGLVWFFQHLAVCFQDEPPGLTKAKRRFEFCPFSYWFHIPLNPRRLWISVTSTVRSTSLKVWSLNRKVSIRMLRIPVLIILMKSHFPHSLPGWNYWNQM